VVKAGDLGSDPMAFVGSAFEHTKHLSGMGPVNLVLDDTARELFPTTPRTYDVSPYLEQWGTYASLGGPA
jgi:hypothetical protein